MESSLPTCLEGVHLKGQIGTEYLVLVIFVFIAVVAIYVISMSTSSEAVAVNLAKTSAKSIAGAAEQVYSLGPGTRIVVKIELPGGINSAILNEKEVGWRLETSSGALNDVYEASKAKLAGELPTTQGVHFVTVEALSSGFVRIGGGLRLIPNAFSIIVPPGQTKKQTLTAWNNTIKKLTNIDEHKSGDINAYTTLGNVASTLDANVSSNFDATFIVPDGHAYAVKIGFISVDSAEGYYDYSSVNLIIPHVLTTITIASFLDSSYSVPASSFGAGNIVYYAIDTNDQTGQPMELSDLNIQIKNPSGVLMERLSNQSTPSGRYNGSYFIPCGSPIGIWSIVADANDYAYVQKTQNFTVTQSACVVLRWADYACNWSTCQSTQNIVSAPDNVYDSTPGTPKASLGGYYFDIAGLGGAISQVRIAWSHEIPAKLSDDSVALNYGLTAYDNKTAKTYTSASTPIDYMDINAQRVEYYDATSNRPGGGSWDWPDFRNLMVGGKYNKVGAADSEWRLDAVGVEITYS